MSDSIPPTLWGIHAGATGDADTLFLTKSVVAIGWVDMGDLSLIPNDLAQFKAEVAHVYPTSKPGAIPVNAGQLYRFVHIIQPGDIVIYRSKHDHVVHIGRVTGPYVYEGSDTGYPNQRSVEWLKHLPHTQFSPAARFEIGSAMSLFRVKNYAAEFIGALQNGQKQPAVNQDDEAEVTVPASAAQVELSTEEFILSRLSQHLKGHDFAHFVAHVFEIMDYKTNVSKPGADGGIDITLYKDEFQLLPPIIRVQVKSGSGPVSNQDVAYLNGILSDGDYGIFVTLTDFSTQARNAAKTMKRLRLINGTDLTELVLRHYDAISPRYKNLIPLKKIYAPDDSEYQSG